jgi:beta-galactosidase/beta-glucuronidase
VRGALAAAALAAALLVPAAPAAADGLRTVWTASVNPRAPRLDYPRPDLVRRDWRSLNGIWQFAYDDAASGERRGLPSGRRALPERIVVPFTFEAPLSGIGDGDVRHVHEHVWYRHTFRVDPGWRGKRILLHFGAVDWRTTVWLNGVKLGDHQGGYEPFTFDITPALRAKGAQRLVVAVYDPVRGRMGASIPRGKQSYHTDPRHKWFTRATGIWQSVWLEPVAATRIDGVRANGDPATGRLSLATTVAGPGGGQVDATVSLNGTRVATAAARVGAGGVATVAPVVESARLWSPEDPALYDVELTLSQGGRVVDRVRTYGAFRTIAVSGRQILLNGRPYFLRGALVHGYWPDGVYTAPSDAALRADVQQAKAFGLNTLRMHLKVEDPRFYYWADRLGILVVQDMPSSRTLMTPTYRSNYEREWRDMITNLESHPSIAWFVAINENWGRPPGYFQDSLVRIAHRLDPTRPVTDASGWNRRPIGDITDIHAYGTRPIDSLVADDTKPQWISEMGGAPEVTVPGHVWAAPITPTTEDGQQLLDRYETLYEQLTPVPYLAGVSWTQLYDTERELNGLETYDRVPKVSPADIAAISRMPVAYGGG